MKPRAAATSAISLVLVAIGVAILVETALLGGGIGYLFGTLFVLVGLGRLYLSTR